MGISGIVGPKNGGYAGSCKRTSDLFNSEQELGGLQPLSF
jgi:hypothetical protein